MVKKPNGKWRMCTDYTNLNKACLKDSYPLPSIDRLVDNVAGFSFLSFMDAYSGYNQIRMHPQDEEKTTFITDEGAFCYKVMPFDLKNAGATYQRLMDKIFKGILGADVEVYVDDMVVKSQGMEEHCEALGQVFHILIEHQLRLNPSKCSFGVRAWKFLGFMLTERGIEANPKKCQAVTKMRSPRSVKEVQQFMGKITALSRFISKVVETAIPLFATLKKGGKFTWMDECEEAFLRLKAMMATPPMLIRPRPRTPLYLYISVSDAAVSSALIQEEGGEQQPVYFTSKVLQGAERRYQKIEKAALVVVVASRRLRRYFQNFSIIVRTDLPIRQVLRKPDMAERMVAWSIQLSEFDISFERRGHVKAQALADFITENLPANDKGEWYLSVDGSTNQSGSGAGVILEGPEGVLIEQSLHFDFRASNNQAEYEALLAGMRLARDLEARSLIAKSDSKLVTGQLARYKERAVKLVAGLERFELIHVSRDQNERADLLAKLASTQRRGHLRAVPLSPGIICRFGLLAEIVSDNETQFASKTTVEFCNGLGIKQIFTSTNGQAEAANKVILKGLRRRLEEAKGRWAEKLPHVLWSYHTTPHSAINETPFRLTFGTEAVISVEIGEPSIRTTLFEPNANENELRANLDMLQEVREATHIREFAIKSRIAKLYNRRVIPRSFRPHDLVLIKMVHKVENNKLTPKWEGPFRVKKEVGQGAYRLEKLKGKEIPRTWNAATLRMYYRRGTPLVDQGLASDKSYKCHLYGRPGARLG
ncbi:Retrovirus-related Pol polyprotein from transposon 17.6, partial [Mucuna pruriens]